MVIIRIKKPTAVSCDEFPLPNVCWVKTYVAGSYMWMNPQTGGLYNDDCEYIGRVSFNGEVQWLESPIPVTSMELLPSVAAPKLIIKKN